MVKHSVEHRERAGQQRLDEYLDELATALGHADREAPFRSYCLGLLLDGERKSVEPMAARLILSTFRPNISRCITSLLRPCGAMPLCWRRFAGTLLCRHLNGTARSRPGSWTIPGSL